MQEQIKEIISPETYVFAGNIYIFQAFDIGDEINLEKVKTSGVVTPRPLTLSKYFKNYHIPLAVELPQQQVPSLNCLSAKIHNFGVISLTYKVPFQSSLEDMRERLEALDLRFQEQSLSDVSALFQKLKTYTTKPKFFHTRSSYLIIQVDIDKNMSTAQLKESYSSVIASSLRFETKSLAEYQKNEILESSIGYFKGDLIVVDTKAAFVYDPEYEEVLDFFEFANIQDLELRYFDRLIDQQLNIIYEERVRKVPFKAYLPFIGTLSPGPIDELGKMKVDISVITERLDSNIKLVSEPYFSELYALLSTKLDLKNKQETIEKKLSIVQDIRTVLQHKVDSIREDMLTVLIIVLILIEVLVGLVH
ncbi:MAG TPA: hypothetical protein VFF04_05060 [Candidatus Babeliales bacterium]|nr:hypothetical protein [Candidatus Babeliales bacterium]